MGYRFLVATDMDYTLLVTGMPISSENLRAVRAIHEAGGALTLATGRSSFASGTFARDLDIKVPLITSNGASLFDPVARKEVYSSLMDQNTVKELSSFFIKKDTDATAYSPEGIFFLPGSTRRPFFTKYNENIPEDLKAPVYNFDIENIPEVNKFLLISPDQETEAFLRSMEGLELVSSAYTYFDVMKEGNTKGKGLLMLADMLGIPKDMTFSLGDGEND
ncbi:MAG: HAD-IIB family hydrolase, partial [Clostridiales bacterium]|nr:HAD-IIB family hydrolase [Clostridiales bacterium]